MGVQITELLPIEKVDIKDMSGKIIAVDASLFLYQFITTIRQRDGSLLTDSKGQVTSHLSGLFARTVNLMKRGLKLVYVFDGKMPELKSKERERRRKIKEEAQVKYKLAVEQEDTAGMRKFASRTSRLTSEMIAESKELLTALGVPVVQAPTEAEAQASYMVKRGDAWAVATQDADTFMFGATRVLRNLSMLGKRKKHRTLGFVTVKPELIVLNDILNKLSIDNDQLIALCMLIGTDYNIGGVKGIGPKKAVKLIAEHGKDFDTLFSAVKWEDHFDYPWTDVYYQIKKIKVTDDYELTWSRVNETAVMDLLVEKHEFSIDRVQNGLGDLKDQLQKRSQTSLFDY